MPVHRTVYGAGASHDKVARAKELRRAMTPGETLLWAELRKNRLKAYHFRRQQVIIGYIVDFYCHSAALIVEVDGSVHDDQAEADAERDQALHARGYRVLRIKEEAIHHDLPGVLDTILGALC